MSVTWLSDRIYWRPLSMPEVQWHCFKKSPDGDFWSLCGRAQRPRSGGASLCRPPVRMRCPECDVAEQTRRGVEESLPESEDWRAALLLDQERKNP